MKLGFVILYVPNVPEAVSFYEKAFGLTVGFQHESGDYGELSTGDTTLAFASEDLADSHGFAYRHKRLDEEPGAFEIGLVTDDVQAAYKGAIEAGATKLTEPSQMPWGQWVSYVADHIGNTRGAMYSGRTLSRGYASWRRASAGGTSLACFAGRYVANNENT